MKKFNLNKKGDAAEVFTYILETIHAEFLQNKAKKSD
jgi:hypothetical protein